MFKAAVMIAAAVPAFAFATHASAQGVAGVWETQVPTRMTINNGEQEGTDFATVTFTVELRGDSAFATSKRGPVDGLPEAPASKLKGTFKDGVLTLVSEPREAKRSINGEESTVTTQATYTLKLEGEALNGQITMTSSDDNMQIPARDVKFTRRKA
jgi:hypothetical protein